MVDYQESTKGVFMKGATLKQVAAYQEQGWKVIPLMGGEKNPPQGFPLERAFKNEMTQDELNEWFSRPEVSNVGLVTGKHSGIAVIDVDDLAKVDDVVRKYPTGLRQRTPSGGTHLFYSIPPGVSIHTQVLEPGVELFGDNHYVLLPPSFAKGTRNGRAYSGSYEFVTLGTPSPVPVIQTGDRTALVTADNQMIEVQRSGKYTRTEIQELLEYALTHNRFPDGAHNDAIYYGSLKLLSDGWTFDLVLAMMKKLDAADPTPQGDRRVEGEVRRAKMAADKNTYTVQDAVLGQPAVPQSTQAQVFNQDGAFDAQDFAALMAEYEGYETRWLIDQWLVEQSIIMMPAPPQRFKTWIALDAAISVAYGLPFLGQFDVNQTGNVLIVQQEDFGARLLQRYRVALEAKMAQSGGKIEVESLPNGGMKISSPGLKNQIFFHTRADLSFDDPASLKRFYEKIMEIKPLLVIIDPFYSLSVKDDYFRSAAGIIRSIIKEIRNRTGAAFIFVHHTAKNNNNKTNAGDPTGRENAWGSQFLNAAVEGAWSVGRTVDQPVNSVMVVRRFKDAEEFPPIQVDFNIKYSAPTDAERYVVKVSDASNEKETEVKEFIRDAGTASTGEIFDEFKDRGWFASRPRVSEYLKQLRGVKSVGHGKWSVTPDEGV